MTQHRHTREEMVKHMDRMFIAAWDLAYTENKPLSYIEGRCNRIGKVFMFCALCINMVSDCWVTDHTLQEVSKRLKEVRTCEPLPKEFINPILSYIEWQISER